MYTIWKSQLVLGNNDVEMPKGSNLLTVMVQNDRITVWYRCDNAAPKEVRKLVIVGTGHEAPAPDTSRYIGSVSVYDGTFIWHVFELLG